MSTTRAANKDGRLQGAPKTLETNKYTIDVVVRAAEVLNYLSREDAAPLTEIAEEIGLDKSRVYRILSTLEEVDYVRRDPATKKYSIGYAFSRIGHFDPEDRDIAQIGEKPLQELSLALRQSASIGVLQSTQVRYVARSKYQRLLNIDINVGSLLPAHATSMGKLLLSGLDDEHVKDLFYGEALPVFTEHTISSVTDLLTELAEIRQLGYSTSAEELENSLFGVAVPIFDPRTTNMLAAVSISFTSNSPSFIEESISKLRDCANAITAHL